jgi:tetratricopeptide (TPR) repeat protein
MSRNPPPKRRPERHSSSTRRSGSPGQGAKGKGGARRSADQRRLAGQEAAASEPHSPKYGPAHISDELARELRATARPGKGDILVQVFADAVAAFFAEDYLEAIRLGDQSKHMALRSTAVREFLGLALYRAGRWKEAARELAAYRRISGSTDQNPVLADCYRAMKRPDRAVELCSELNGRDTDPAVFYECAIVSAGALADMGRIDAAIEHLEELELRPQGVEQHHLRAWYALADLLERRGRFTQAREWFEAVAAADPELTDAPDRLARL